MKPRCSGVLKSGAIQALLALLAFSLLGCSASEGGGQGGPDAGNGGSAGNRADEPVSFANDIWPILRSNCTGATCHSEGPYPPPHANADVNVAFAAAQPI